MSHDGAMRQPRGDARGGEDRGAVVAFSRSRDPERPRDNLPLELTSFVGHEREVARAKELLANHRRLLTLTGPGGSGKTRLAVEVAGDLVGDYPDGVWSVELGALARRLVAPRLVADPPSYRRNAALRGPEHLLVRFDRLQGPAGG